MEICLVFLEKLSEIYFAEASLFRQFAHLKIRICNMGLKPVMHVFQPRPGRARQVLGVRFLVEHGINVIKDGQAFQLVVLGEA